MNTSRLSGLIFEVYFWDCAARITGHNPKNKRDTVKHDTVIRLHIISPSGTAGSSESGFQLQRSYGS